MRHPLWTSIQTKPSKFNLKFLCPVSSGLVSEVLISEALLQSP